MPRRLEVLEQQGKEIMVELVARPQWVLQVVRAVEVRLQPVVRVRQVVPAVALKLPQ
jgi:hypothetical protein